MEQKSGRGDKYFKKGDKLGKAVGAGTPLQTSYDELIKAVATLFSLIYIYIYIYIYIFIYIYHMVPRLNNIHALAQTLEPDLIMKL